MGYHGLLIASTEESKLGMELFNHSSTIEEARNQSKKEYFPLSVCLFVGLDCIWVALL